MASHATIKPLQHAGIASQDRLYIAGGAIVEGSPVVFSSGKVIAASDGADGVVVDSSADESTAIVGIALNAAAAANEDVLVALALPGREFVASLGANATTGATDDGSVTLALNDIGDQFEMHKDATTAKWLLGAVAASGKGGAMVTGLIDKVGASTTDSITFGSSGLGPNVTGSSTTPPGRTFEQDPPGGPNSGQAKVTFIFPINTTIFGVTTVA